MPDVALFRVKIFADGADRASILDLAANPLIKGFTTNPTLMRQAGITDYESFGRSLARAIPNRPFSFEVLSDDFDQMEQQAQKIATWGDNVYVKIPITDTRGRSSAALVKRLAQRGVKINVTALMTLDQVDAVAGSLGLAARHLADRYWPGGLTLVVPRAPGFTVDLGGPPAARMTVGVRWPDHPSIDQLCRAIGPLAVTSANRHGAPPATTAAEVLAELSGVEQSVVVLDGGRCAGAPSTVVECRGPATRCLREGAVPWQEMAGDPLNRAILD